MGRKIPGKKHRGVKDPEKQREKRIKSIADKVNAPPKDPEEQALSSSLKRVIELKDVAKNPRPPCRKKPALKYVQQPNESDKKFMHRINLDCQSVIKEQAFEDKYKVKIKRNQATGKVEEVVKAGKDQLWEYMKKLKKEQKNKSKKKKATEEKPRLTKSQKRSLKLKEKKQKKAENNFTFDTQKDEVRFGEVVHEPPTLVAPRKTEKNDNKRKPGEKDLLMKSLLSPKSVEVQKKIDGPKKKQDMSKVTKTIDKKQKRKLLPVALRRQLEKDQKEMINIYRQLKADKLKK